MTRAWEISNLALNRERISTIINSQPTYETRITALFSKSILYALKSTFPNKDWSGAPVGPNPMAEAAEDGVTRRTAVWSSSMPCCANRLFQIFTRFCLNGTSDALAKGPLKDWKELGGSWPCVHIVKRRHWDYRSVLLTSNVSGLLRVTMTVSWYSPSAMRTVAGSSSSLVHDS